MVKSYHAAPTRDAPKAPADALMFAAIDCAHHIEDRQIVLKIDASKPGNALHQLTKRLETALPRAAVGIMPPAAMPETVAKAMELARASATARRDAAAHDGRYDDGGAGHIEALCAAYRSGLRREVPDFLSEFVTQAEREADPEYAQYQRLHAKFAGKA
jgi:hypothetical protein